MASQIITLGIGAISTLTPFITTGLGIGVVPVFIAPDNAMPILFRDKRDIMEFRDKRTMAEFRDKRVEIQFRDKRDIIEFRDKRIINRGN